MTPFLVVVQRADLPAEIWHSNGQLGVASYSLHLHGALEQWAMELLPDDLRLKLWKRYVDDTL